MNREPAGTPTGGQFAISSNTESAAQLDVAASHGEPPTNPSEVTDEHLRDAMSRYLDTNDGLTYEEWAEELDYEDEDFGVQIEQAVQCLSHSSLPGASQASVTSDPESATVDIGVYDPVNGRHCTSYSEQREFWSGEDAEPMERADYLMRRAYDGVVRQQNLVDDQRERDTRLATMQRSMTWQMMPIETKNTMQVRKDTLQAAYPGLSDDEALVGTVRLLAAPDEIERHRTLADLQATSDERSPDYAASQEAFTRAMSEAGIYKRAVAGFVGANLRQDELDKVAFEETDEHALRTFWSRARLATGRSVA